MRERDRDNELSMDTGKSCCVVLSVLEREREIERGRLRLVSVANYKTTRLKSVFIQVQVLEILCRIKLVLQRQKMNGNGTK